MENYEQKYNKLVNAIKVLQETNPSDEGIQSWVNDNVPELAEPEDEKVRKWLYNYFRSLFSTWIHPDITCGEILDWLEKQVEQKQKQYDIDILEKHITKDSVSELAHTVIVRNGWEIVDAKEQKPADKIEPKFKVGDNICRKTPSSCDKDMQVARIEKDYYICNHIGKFSSEVIPFSKESSYELIEQKPTWSKKDDETVTGIINDI